MAELPMHNGISAMLSQASLPPYLMVYSLFGRVSVEDGDLRFLKEMVNWRPPNSTFGSTWITWFAVRTAIARKYRELIAWGVAFTNAMPVLHRRARKRHEPEERLARKSPNAHCCSLRAGRAARHGVTPRSLSV